MSEICGLILFIITLVRGRLPKFRIPQIKPGTAALALTAALFALDVPSLHAAFPDQPMPDTLRERMLKRSPLTTYLETNDTFVNDAFVVESTEALDQ